MGSDLLQLLSLLATFMSAVGILVIIYSRDTGGTANRLFILILVLIIGYLVSHGVHFLLMYNNDVTVLDISCHSFLLLIIVALTFFTWNYPVPQKINPATTILILLPSVVLLMLLWNGSIIYESRSHMEMFEAKYTPIYPLYLFWYIYLIGLNIYWTVKKRRVETNEQMRSQLTLFMLGMIITNLVSFVFGLLLPWVLGFYFLVEMSPLAFLAGVILFTAVAIGKYNMFPAALEKVNKFSINKKMFFSSVILVPIIILIVQIPLGRLIFNVETNLELTRYFLISFFVGIIVSLSITFVILQVISNPLNKMKARVNDIERGNYGIEIEYSSNDEIGEVTNAFNKMSRALKKNSEELQRKENRIMLLLNAFENAAAAISILDENYFVIECNQQFCKFVRADENTVIGKPIKELQFINNEKYFDEIINILTKQERFNGEFEFENSNKEKKHLLISATLVKIENKVSSGFLFVELDITDKKKLEEQLAQSEKLAALGKMAAVLAHEIKTPLTSIKLNTDMLSESLELNSEDRSSFNIISKEINRMNNLVKEVLQFSRQMELNYTSSDIKEIIESIIHETHNKTEIKNISVINKTEEQFLEIDTERIKQVLLNMLDNSIEAIKKEGMVEISSSINKEKNEYSIIITDTGYGIKDAQKIFEPFVTTKASGTGLGLAISQKIIEQHKGKLILVSSVPGKTVFEITLPITKIK